jgi:hypothetical protein
MNMKPNKDQTTISEIITQIEGSEDSEKYKNILV